MPLDHQYKEAKEDGQRRTFLSSTESGRVVLSEVVVVGAVVVVEHCDMCLLE